MDKTFSIQQVADRTGLSIHTLRYYEQIGLLVSIYRLPNGHRRYSEANIRWIAFIKCLRAAGMPLVEIQRFTQIMEDGEEDAMVRNKRTLLETHHHNLSQHLQDVQQILARIEDKLALLEV